jgi:fatty acid desaturase
MEGFVGRRGLIAPDRLRELNRKSDVRGGMQLASHTGAIALTTACLAVTWGTWLAVFFFLAQGALLNFLYCAQHEMSHSTVFKTRGLNEIFGRIIGFLQLYPRDFDRIQHFAHHRHTGDWEKDPELFRGPYTLTSYLLWFLGPAYWYSRSSRLFRLLFGIVIEPYVREDEKPVVIREARWHLAGYAVIAALSVAFETWIAVTYWLAPMLLMKWTYMLQGTLKHLGLPHADNLLENTRTARANALMRWVCWNMPYHTAHHVFPSVPFHRLPLLHKEITARTGQEPPTMGYLAFQYAVIGKLAGVKSEAMFSDGECWVAEGSGRKAVRA